MQLSKIQIQRIYIAIALISWVLLLLADNFNIFNNNEITGRFSNSAISGFVFAIFSLSVFLFYKLTIGTFEGEGFNDLLWKSFVTGFVVTILLAICVYFETNYLLPENILPQTIFYHLLTAFSIIFISVNLFAFKKMILYQKSKEVSNLWKIFEYLIYSVLAMSLLKLKNTDILFGLACIPVSVMGIILCLNLRWVAYLNFGQKLKSIFYLLLLLVCDVFFGWVIFRFSIVNASLTANMAHSVFAVSLLGFIGIYCFFSVLVLLFNLPTSSVFEQKFSEIVNLQKLSRTAHSVTNEDEIYEALIDSCSGTFVASATVLEIKETAENTQKMIYRNIDKDIFFVLKTALRKNNLKPALGEYVLVEDLSKLKYIEAIELQPFNSVLAISLEIYGERLGNIYMLSEIKNGFEKEMIGMVNTYVNQASTSISNFRLISQAVKTAKYKEELEIAKKVQQNLLPLQNIDNQFFKIIHFSESADEVGGDYFDYLQISDKKWAIVIGDVSGKGTSAAFQMAVLKGIFNSLVHTHIATDEFVFYANKALSQSLDKSSFATLTILYLDFENMQMESSRAGHCPTLVYNIGEQSCTYFIQKGLGLGISRNESYRSHIGKENLSLAKGDMMMLFTDGIAEAVNENGEEFGYERIADFLKVNHQLPLNSFKNAFIEYLHSFCGSTSLSDDHTVLFIEIN
jgi:hypothetical protein